MGCVELGIQGSHYSCIMRWLLGIAIVQLQSQNRMYFVTVQLYSLCKDRQFGKAEELFVEMKGNGVSPNVAVYNSPIDCFVSHGLMGRG